MSDIISKPYSLSGEDTWDRVFKNKYKCEFRPCSLTKPYGDNYIHTLCGDNCFIRQELLRNAKS